MLLKRITIEETFILWSSSSKINKETRPHPLEKLQLQPIITIDKTSSPRKVAITADNNTNKIIE